MALASRRGDPGRVASGLGSTAGTAVSGVLALGELVSDKLPATPSWLAPPALGGRVLLGGTAAAAERAATGTTRCCPRSSQPGSRSGAAVLGNRLRGVAAQRFGSDKPGAFLEDGLAGPPGLAGSAPAVDLISGMSAGAGRLAARRRPGPPAAFF